MELQRQLERTQHEHALRLQQQAGQHTQELERKAREHDAVASQAQERMAELEVRARGREDALKRQADAAEERAMELQRQLEHVFISFF